ncbi:MAG: hypothetical protein KC635_06205 [Myxococcales bacterium]|nr:hypothetical protein [Myxococcales bacterium]
MSRLALVAACAALAACGDAAAPGVGSPGVTVAIAPLTLDGVVDAEYRVRVAAGGEVVWERVLTSGAYGDGAGGVSYVGPCDASFATNDVTVTLLSLRDATGPLAAGSWSPPPPATKAAPCSPSADTRVDFDLTVARAARQGFFDVAVELDDVFCSAKLDCGATTAVADDLLLLQDPITGERATTAVLGFACTAGPESDAATTLYLDDVVIRCDGRPDTVVAVGAPGRVDLGTLPSANPDGYLFDAVVYAGEQASGGVVYWNVALGLDRAAFAASGACSLSTVGTASSGPLEGGATPAGATWPVIVWDVPLSDASGRVCTEHEVGDPGGRVVIDYRGPDVPEVFDRGRDAGGPVGGGGGGGESGGNIAFVPEAGPKTVGAGLEAPLTVLLPAPVDAPEGATITIASGDPSRLLLATSGATAGAASVELTYANGIQSHTLWIQGVPGAAGDVVITATRGGETSWQSVSVVAPMLHLEALAGDRRATAVDAIPDDTFVVQTGIPNPEAVIGFSVQRVSAAAGPLTVTIASSDPAVATVATASGAAATQTRTIAPNVYTTPLPLASGGLAARFPAPPVAGTTTITASAPGFTTATQALTVSVVATYTYFDDDLPTLLGGGLQVGIPIGLSDPSHGGRVATVTVSDPSVAVVSSSRTGAGGASVDLTYVNGDNLETVWFQGVPGATGTVDVLVTCPGFADSWGTIAVRPGTMDIEVLAPYQTVASTQTPADDPFRVRFGVLDAAGTTYTPQEVSGAVAPLAVTFALSGAAVGELYTATERGSAVVLAIPAGTIATGNTTGTGGVALDFFGPPPVQGTVTVSATAPGFAATALSSQTVQVSVSAATITFTTIPAKVGASFSETLIYNLSAAPTGGSTVVHFEVSDFSKAAVAPLDASIGGETLDVVVNSGGYRNIRIHGRRGATGSVTITATSPGYLPASTTVPIVQGYIAITGGWNASVTTTAGTPIADYRFSVGVGYSNTGTGINTNAVIAGTDAPLPVTVTRSGAAVFDVATSGAAGVVATYTQAAGTTTVSNVARLVYKNPPVAGTGTVTVTAPGFISTLATKTRQVIVN